MYKWSKIERAKFPTLYDLSTAKELADPAKDKDAISSRELIYVLQKLYELPRISGNLKTRKTAITVYDWRIEPDKSITLSETELAKIKARLLKPINLILDNCNDYNIYGQFCAKVEKGELINNECRVKLNKLELTDYTKIDDDTFILFDDSGAGSRKIIELADLQTEYLYHTDGLKNQGGEVSSIAENAIYLHSINSEWSAIIKRLKGIVLGTMDGEGVAREGAMLNLSDADMQKMVTDLHSTLEGIGRDSNALATLKSIEVKLASIVDSGASAALQIYKNELVDDIAIAILGQANTTELPSGGGSRAALQVLAKISADIALQDAIMTERAINKLLAIDYRINRDPTAYEAPYRFKFVLDDLIDGESEARKLNYLSTSGIDLPLSRKEVYEKLGYSAPTDEADTITLKKDTTTLAGF